MWEFIVFFTILVSILTDGFIFAEQFGANDDLYICALQESCSECIEEPTCVWCFNPSSSIWNCSLLVSPGIESQCLRILNRSEECFRGFIPSKPSILTISAQRSESLRIFVDLTSITLDGGSLLSFVFRFSISPRLHNEAQEVNLTSVEEIQNLLSRGYFDLDSLVGGERYDVEFAISNTAGRSNFSEVFGPSPSVMYSSSSSDSDCLTAGEIIGMIFGIIASAFLLIGIVYAVGFFLTMGGFIPFVLVIVLSAFFFPPETAPAAGAKKPVDALQPL